MFDEIIFVIVWGIDVLAVYLVMELYWCLNIVLGSSISDHAGFYSGTLVNIIWMMDDSSNFSCSVCGDGDVNFLVDEICDDGNTDIEVCVYGEISCTVCNASC